MLVGCVRVLKLSREEGELELYWLVRLVEVVTAKERDVNGFA